ncbi:hypothetical protein [Staphylococcus gallinarum]|uniref:Uncharacterized protein n=1 Tax=Staphylococcus gallinarum TaxID=1293 RepID=A0A380FFD5_STAGA|nr:hypothetical protein [Staphylococcus gallinarum]GEQ04615.1 hypothetical protein SGA02_04430 [Staphylococcus gallinarum]SUM32193.1 Uncharacterised protein [Staphylococcus gallinarum]
MKRFLLMLLGVGSLFLLVKLAATISIIPEDDLEEDEIESNANL